MSNAYQDFSAGAGALPTVPNNFDPSASGLAASVGIVVETADRSKSWKKWGAADTNWIALHSVDYVSTLSANFDIPLYCETAGGFRVEISGLSSNATNAAHFRARLNLATYTGNGMLTDTVNNLGNASGAAAATAAAAICGGGPGADVDLTNICFMSFECLQPQSARGARIIRVVGEHWITSDYLYTRKETSWAVPVDRGEIASIGVNLTSTGNTSLINAGAVATVFRIK